MDDGAKGRRADVTPDDVWEEILLRVPRTSLHPCKLVCKLWRAIIDHRRTRLPVGNTVVLSWKSHETKQQVFSLLTYEDKYDDHELQLPCAIDEIRLPPVADQDREYFPQNMVGSHSNGITCFFELYSNAKQLFVLCNPALSEFRLLDTPTLDCSYHYFFGAGLGYDPIGNVYKLFKLFKCLGSPYGNRALVYTLGTNCWREVKVHIRCKFYLSGEGVYLRGVYYCLNFSDGRVPTEMILSFDFSSEEFRSIQLPNEFRYLAYRKTRKLAVWKHAVALFISPDVGRNSTSFDMWVMGSDQSWTKHFSIGPLSPRHIPLVFGKDDELLMQSENNQHFSYNLNRKIFRRIRVIGMSLSSRAFLYSESLVSIKVDKGEPRLVLFQTESPTQ